MDFQELTKVQENSNKYLFSKPLAHYSYQTFCAHLWLTHWQKMSELSDLISEKEMIIMVMPVA